MYFENKKLREKVTWLIELQWGDPRTKKGCQKRSYSKMLNKLNVLHRITGKCQRTNWLVHTMVVYKLLKRCKKRRNTALRLGDSHLTSYVYFPITTDNQCLIGRLSVEYKQTELRSTWLLSMGLGQTENIPIKIKNILQNGTTYLS